jgi:tRNA(fMet)-specific endonuclease VapC
VNLHYLVDTDWIIHYLHGRKDITARLATLKESGLAISIISLAELYEGIYYSTNPEGNEQGLKDFLTGVTILNVEDSICKVFGQLRGKLRKEKKLIDDFDLLIASTSIHHNLILLSNNRKHYELVDGLEILSLP